MGKHHTLDLIIYMRLCSHATFVAWAFSLWSSSKVQCGLVNLVLWTVPYKYAAIVLLRQRVPSVVDYDSSYAQVADHQLW